MKLRALTYLLLLLLAAPGLQAKKPAENPSARRADYFFLEAKRAEALGQNDRYMALMNRAYELAGDPASREAYEVGAVRMALAGLREDSLSFARAVRLVDAYVSANPRDFYPALGLARTYAQAGKADRAVEIYETLEEYKPTNANLIAGHAEALIALKRFPEAIDLYRRLEKTIGSSAALTQRISNIQIWKGDTLAALAEVDSLIARQPRNVDALHLGASAALQFSGPDRALDYIRRAEALDPTNGMTYYYAAQAYHDKGDEENYEKAIRGAIDGDDLSLDDKIELLRLYVANAMNGDDPDGLAKCEPLFLSMVRQYPHEREPRMLYLSFLAAQGNWAEAAEQMSYAIAADPSDPADFEQLVRFNVMAKDIPGALRAVDEAVGQFPSEVPMRRLKATVQTVADDHAGAVRTLEEILKMDSVSVEERSEILRDMADILQQIDETDSRIPGYYEESLTLNPDNDLAANNYAYWLSNNGGDLLKARQLIAAAVLAEPGSSTYYDTYAWVCYRLGQLEDAKRYIDMALLFDKSVQENSPDQLVELLDHAAEIYSALGQKEKAEEYRQRAAQLNEEKE